MVELLQGILHLLSRIQTAFTWIYKYRKVYQVTGIFFTRRFPPAKRNHKYAVLVAARNEEAVLGNLIDMQFLGSAYNPHLGSAISLVMMVIVLVCMAVMNRFGEGEEGVTVL